MVHWLLPTSWLLRAATRRRQPQPQYVIHNSGVPVSGVPVVTQDQPEIERNKLKPSALSQMKGLSITQIVMGVLCMAFGIVLVALESVYGTTAYYSYISYGIWNGFYFVLVGGIGLGAVKYNSSCWIISAMILNIICSSIFFLPLLVMCAVGIGIGDVNEWCYELNGYGYGYGYDYACGLLSVSRSVIAFNSMMLLISIAELVITIWSAVLCCGAACDCCYPVQPYQRIITTTVHNQQQYNMHPNVPATTIYGVGTPGYPQVSVHSSVNPVAIHQQPTGGYMTQPQGPPSYYTANQTAPPQSSGYVQSPPPTVYPNDPQHSNKQQQ